MLLNRYEGILHRFPLRSSLLSCSFFDCSLVFLSPSFSTPPPPSAWRERPWRILPNEMIVDRLQFNAASREHTHSHTQQSTQKSEEGERKHAKWEHVIRECALYIISRFFANLVPTISREIWELFPGTGITENSSNFGSIGNVAFLENLSVSFEAFCFGLYREKLVPTFSNWFAHSRPRKCQQCWHFCDCHRSICIVNFEICGEF